MESERCRATVITLRTSPPERGWLRPRKSACLHARTHAADDFALVRVRTMRRPSDGTAPVSAVPPASDEDVVAEVAKMKSLDDAATTHFESAVPGGKERKVRVEFPFGVVEHYEGPPGQERKVREVYTNGKVQYYEGPKGNEEMVYLNKAPKG